MEQVRRDWWHGGLPVRALAAKYEARDSTVDVATGEAGCDRRGANEWHRPPGCPFGSNRRETPMRYGMNPHQSASIVAGHGPRVINGEPSMINYLDALNAFELVREAGVVDATAARIWRVD